MLYLHIPYCRHKCTYCGFYSVAGHRDMEAYVTSLCSEIAARSTGKPLKTVYFGGGTPSLLSLGQLERVTEAICAGFDTDSVEEATIEMNPDNMCREYLDGIASLHFFNRISIGVQSFSDSELKMLNRVHSSRQAVDAINNAADAGFDNLSVDLMMGLPNPGSVGLQYSLERLGELLPMGVIKHLSCYELTVEPGTILERQLKMGRLQLPEDEEVAAQYDTLRNWCAANGFEQYEVSNYSRPGWRSLHNSRYWNRTPYIGVGAAAHSFDGERRRWNLADIASYIDGAGKGSVPFEEELLTEDDAYNEYIMTALRTVEGIEKSAVPAGRMGYLSERIEPFVRKGLITDTPTHYVPTADALLQADGIAATLFCG